jgi:hypothetical protein
MSPASPDETTAATAAAVVAMAAFGALLVGAAVGPPGLLIGGLAGALVGFLAWC